MFRPTRSNARYVAVAFRYMGGKSGGNTFWGGLVVIVRSFRLRRARALLIVAAGIVLALNGASGISDRLRDLGAPTSESNWIDIGSFGAVAGLVAMLLGSVIGGIRGERWHERLVERALKFGGTCSGEHGVGVGKLKYLAAEHGEALDVMRSIKHAIDPHNLMNPGKLIPGP